jgi:hypothetical protein
VTVHPIGGAVGALAGPRREVEVGDQAVSVRMGWMGWAIVPRSSITSARVTSTKLIDGIGIHGFRGRWVINGRMGKAVELTIDPPARLKITGLPVKLTTLVVGVDDPAALVAELSPSS